MVTAHELVRWLRLADTLVENGVLPVVRLARGDRGFAWHTLPGCTDGGWPGIDVGQNRDCRYATDGADGLHLQTFDHHCYVEVHLDQRDACRDPVGHAAADTNLLPGLVVGTLLGALIGGAAKGGKGATAGAAAGAAIGGLVGGHIPKRSRLVLSLVELATLVSRR